MGHKRYTSFEAVHISIKKPLCYINCSFEKQSTKLVGFFNFRATFKCQTTGFETVADHYIMPCRCGAVESVLVIGEGC